MFVCLEKLRCIDGVVVGNTCYKLLYRVGVSVNYERAKSLCTFHGGALLEIPTEEVFKAVFDYVKANWYIELTHPHSAYIHCWLGSNYDVSSFVEYNELKLTDKRFCASNTKNA